MGLNRGGVENGERWGHLISNRKSHKFSQTTRKSSTLDWTVITHSDIPILRLSKLTSKIGKKVDAYY